MSPNYLYFSALNGKILNQFIVGEDAYYRIIIWTQPEEKHAGKKWIPSFVSVCLLFFFVKFKSSKRIHHLLLYRPGLSQEIKMSSGKKSYYSIDANRLHKYVTIYCLAALTLRIFYKSCFFASSSSLYYIHFGSACNLRSPVFTRDSRFEKRMRKKNQISIVYDTHLLNETKKLLLLPIWCVTRRRRWTRRSKMSNMVQWFFP